jgi:hypothetical protein
MVKARCKKTLIFQQLLLDEFQTWCESSIWSADEFWGPTGLDLHGSHCGSQIAYPKVKF